MAEVLNPGTIVAAVAALASAGGAYITATRSRRKQPEDRESIIAQTAERVVTMLRAELEDCLNRRRDLEGRVARLEVENEDLRDHVASLEHELRRLGGTPDTLRRRPKRSR